MTLSDRDRELLANAVGFTIANLDQSYLEDFGPDELDPAEHGDVDRLSDAEVDAIYEARLDHLETAYQAPREKLTGGAG